MSEQPAVYQRTPRDYCGVCGELLKPAPLGGRYACHPDGAMYWSEVEPLPADARGFGLMTGLYVRMQSEWYDLRPESGDFGRRITHAPVYLYRSVLGGFA